MQSAWEDDKRKQCNNIMIMFDSVFMICKGTMRP